MGDRLRLDYNNMLSTRLGKRGVDAVRFERTAARFNDVHTQVTRQRSAGELGFFDLPFETETVQQIRAFADGVGQAFDTVVVLGIGGSALGTTAMLHALNKPFWNELDDEARDYFLRLYVLDNIDPTTIGPFLERLDLRRTLFNVVSKSGATAETMAQFLIIRERLVQELEDGYRRHLIFTTDPEKGVLRQIAQDENIAALPIPANVGGRFSVLSAVGLLPAALVGIDIEALLDGARAMDKRCRTEVLKENPAGLFAALQFLADQDLDARTHVMMAYSDRLYASADWFRQLWAESLGKRVSRNGEEVYRGPTPVKALGATDQHSQVQLYVEGPFDKTITFLTVDEQREDVAIPGSYESVDALSYLGGHSLGELLRAEQVATSRALAEHGRMNMTLELPRLDARALGELFMMLQIATAYAGALYNVNAFDQPGVEHGKELTYALMGKKGYSPPEPYDPDPRMVCS
jgi:glucose-6-phosphate isomerase